MDTFISRAYYNMNSIVTKEIMCDKYYICFFFSSEEEWMINITVDL